MESIRQNLRAARRQASRWVTKPDRSLPWANTSAMDGEQPKVVFYQERLRSFLRCLVHLIPVVTTFGVLALNLCNVYYGDAGAPHQNLKLQAMQFASKMHEALIVASLSTIVLYHIRYNLLNGDGVSLSVLPVGHLLGQWSQLLRPSLWNGLFGSGELGRYPQQLHLAVLATVAIFLASTCGPASAIAMIPKLDWWPTATDNNGVTYAFPAAVTDLWPSNVTAANVPSDKCCLPGGNTIQACPSGGYLTLLQYIQFGDSSGPGQANITFQQNNTARSVACKPLSCDRFSSSNCTYVASTVSQLVADALWAYWSPDQKGFDASSMSRDRISMTFYENGKFLSVRKPQVEVTCELNIYQPVQSQTQLYLPSLDGNLETTWGFDPSTIWNLTAFQDANGTEAQFTWVNVSTPERPSIGAAFLIPGYNLTKVEDSDFSIEIDGKTIPTYAKPPEIVACSADARWVPVNVWLDPESDNFAHQDTVFYNTTTTSKTKDPPPQRIYIDPSWAEVLNLVPDGDGGNATQMQNLIRPLSGDAEFYAPQEAWSFLLSIFLADALARVTPPGGAILQDSSHLDALTESAHAGEWAYVRFANFRYGYGYGVRGAVIKLAIAILLAHAALALVHTVRAVVGGWSSTAWGSVEELIALAVNSPPSRRLQNTCAGIGNLDTWRAVLRIRVKVLEGAGGARPGHLEMVFDDEDLVEKHIVSESEVSLQSYTTGAAVEAGSVAVRYEKPQAGVAYGAL